MVPWDTGNLDENWAGYFIPGTRVLRNLVGATTPDELEDAENDLVEVRVLELVEDPSLISRTYDLPCLQAIHRHLFQDVYPWAGELRTVGTEKGDEAFCPIMNIEQAMSYVAGRLHDTSNLRTVRDSNLADELADLYDYVNFAHPFREGNGRSTRVFFDMLLAERGMGLDWLRRDAPDLNDACHRARAEQDKSGLVDLFETIIDHEPAYDL